MIFAYVAHRLLALIGQKYCLRSLALVEVASAPTGPAACPERLIRVAIWLPFLTHCGICLVFEDQDS